MKTGGFLNLNMQSIFAGVYSIFEGDLFVPPHEFLLAISNRFKRKFSVCAFWPTFGFYGRSVYD
jgi:hypothetical protein